MFVKAQLTGEVVYELRNTTNVIDILRGREKTSKPVPLRESEVMKMLGTADEMRQPQAEDGDVYVVGEVVKVNDGPFSGFNGVIKEVMNDKKKIKVEVKIFGRATDLELENSQVERE